MDDGRWAEGFATDSKIDVDSGWSVVQHSLSMTNAMLINGYRMAGNGNVYRAVLTACGESGFVLVRDYMARTGHWVRTSEQWYPAFPLSQIARLTADVNIRIRG